MFSSKGKTPIDDEIFDDEPVSPLGHHLGLTIASTPQGRFIYWKGLEPPELLGLDARLVAYIPDYSDESHSDRHIFMADTAPENVSADELTANTSNENDTDRDARRERNRARAQRRADARQRQHHQTQRNLQEEFERAAQQGFHSPVANIMHAARLLDHVNDPAVHQSINLLQHAALQLNDKEKMPYLSHNCTWSNRTPRGR